VEVDGDSMKEMANMEPGAVSMKAAHMDMDAVKTSGQCITIELYKHVLRYKK
jgi:hypothetical protein